MASYSFEHVTIRALATAVPDHVKVFDQTTPKVQRFVKQIGIELWQTCLTCFRSQFLENALDSSP